MGVVIYEEDSVLLVRHTKKAKFKEGVYGFPAGGVENGESLRAAAIRELKEETGLVTLARDLYELPKKERTLETKHGPKDLIFHPFICENYSGKLRQSEENIPEFVALDCLDDIPLVHTDVRDIARKYCN